MIPHVVVIGGGYAGSMLGRALESDVRVGKCRLTLIERRDTFHHKIGSIRASVRAGDYVSRVEIPLTDILKYAKIVEGSVARVDSESNVLELEDGKIIHYDVLICATGIMNHSSGDLPPSVRGKAAILGYFNVSAQAIEKAQKISIVGGGPSAIEYAGEIRALYPKKQITLVCSSAQLLSSCIAPPTAKFMRLLYKKLQQLEIVVIRGEKVVSPTPDNFTDGHKFIAGPLKVRTKGLQNLEMDSDLVIWAAPHSISSGLYPEEWLNSSGELFVEDTFLVRDAPKRNVFAFGDVCSVAETKQAITLPEKVALIRANILLCVHQLSKNAPASSAVLKKYSWTDRMVMYLPLGPSKGVSQIGTWTYDDKKTSKWKGEDLYTDHFWLVLAGKTAPARPTKETG